MVDGGIYMLPRDMYKKKTTKLEIKPQQVGENKGKRSLP